MLNKIRRWFKDSETIFLARLEVFIGFLITVGASLDWSPLLSLGATPFTWHQAAFIGAVMMVKGILLEIARRHRATDL